MKFLFLINIRSFTIQIELWRLHKRPVVNFINVKGTNFLYQRHFFRYMSIEKRSRNAVSCEKFVRLTLMKLTPEIKAAKIRLCYV